MLESIQQHIEAVHQLEPQLPVLKKLAEKCIAALKGGHKIIFAGNGGSASDAEHLAAEFVGRFFHDRASLPALALTTNSSLITAIANDYGYDQIFARQLTSLAQKEDIFIALSTSGNSANLLSAMEVAQKQNMYRFGFLGRTGGTLKSLCSDDITIPMDNTARIQELHILMGHLLCEEIDKIFVL